MAPKQEYHSSNLGSAASQLGEFPSIFRASVPSFISTGVNDFQGPFQSHFSDISLNVFCDSDPCNVTHRLRNSSTDSYLRKSYT